MSFLLNEIESGFEPVTTCSVANEPTIELPILDFFVSKLISVQRLRLPDERERERESERMRNEEREKDREMERDMEKDRERGRER